MPQNERSKLTLLRIWSVIVSIGPAIFLVGGTIGTGSVTAMTKSGSQFGTQLLWVVFISCFFSWKTYGQILQMYQLLSHQKK